MQVGRVLSAECSMVYVRETFHVTMSDVTHLLPRDVVEDATRVACSRLVQVELASPHLHAHDLLVHESDTPPPLQDHVTI